MWSHHTSQTQNCASLCLPTTTTSTTATASSNGNNSGKTGGNDDSGRDFLNLDSIGHSSWQSLFGNSSSNNNYKILPQEDELYDASTTGTSESAWDPTPIESEPIPQEAKDTTELFGLFFSSSGLDDKKQKNYTSNIMNNNDHPGVENLLPGSTSRARQIESKKRGYSQFCYPPSNKSVSITSTANGSTSSLNNDTSFISPPSPAHSRVMGGVSSFNLDSGSTTTNHHSNFSYPVDEGAADHTLLQSLPGGTSFLAGDERDLMLMGINDNAGSQSTSSNTNGSTSSDGMVFRRFQAEQWQEKYQELCKYKEEYGDCSVPHSWKKNPSLANWVKRQRHQYKAKYSGDHTNLTDERQLLLEQIGFVWDSHGCIWEERFNELVAFKETYGHCNVPSKFADNQRLAIWVKSQRRHYKVSVTTGKTSIKARDRFMRLAELGFVFIPRQPKGVSV